MLEEFVYWVSSYGSGADVDGICALEGPVGTTEQNEDGDDFILAQANGDLISVIEIRGARKYVGRNALDAMVENFSKAVGKLFRAGSGNQYSVSIGFRSDPAKAVRLVSEILAPQVDTARRFGIQNIRMLKDRRDAIASVCSDETVYFVLRSNRLALQPHEIKSQQEERNRLNDTVRTKAEGLKLSGKLSQKVAAPLGALLPRHAAAVRSLSDDLTRDLEAGGAQLLVKVLSNHDAVRLMRKHLDADQISPDWRPRLLGDKSAALGSSSIARQGQADSFMPLRLSRQMLNAAVSDVFDSRELARKGETWYASVVLELCPDEGSEPFHELASRIGRKMPWRATFDIQPNGMNYRAMEKFLVPVLGAFSD
jgi:intracellular multiplication protein IcmB